MEQNNWVLKAEIGERQVIGLDLSIPAREYRMQNVHTYEFNAEITVEFDPEQKIFVAKEITTGRKPGGPELTSALLRTLRVQEAIQDCTLGLVQIPNGNGGFFWLDHAAEFPPEYVLAEVKADGPSKENLVWAARLYILARALRLPPAKQVAEGLGLLDRTASNWISKAKKLGLIEN